MSFKRQACKRGDTGGWSTDADTLLSSSRCNIRKIYKSWQSGGISAEVTIFKYYHAYNAKFLGMHTIPNVLNMIGEVQEFRKYYEKEPVIIVGGRDNAHCRNLCRKVSIM
jgi:hypothetical protein